MFKRLTHLLLLAIFAGISLLGSAGLHDVLDVAHHGRGHSHQAEVSKPATKHVGCHHHKHSHQETESSHSKPHDHDAPAHDHDCPVCDWFANAYFADLPTPTLPLFERLALRPLAQDVVATECAAGVPPARGPPLLRV